MFKKIDTKKPNDNTKDKTLGSTQENQVADLKKQIEDLTNKWKRALADYQNLEKRTIVQRQDAAKYASQEIVTKLLFVLDILEQAEKHIKDQGLTLAVKGFKDVLNGEGIVKIDVLHKKFNPTEMDCVEVVEGNEDDQVVEEVRPGYRMADKIIRVARVKVSKIKVKN